MEAHGKKDDLLASITDPPVWRFAEINYSSWDRLAGNEAFIEGRGAKPKGANFYSADMLAEEFKTAVGQDDRTGQYRVDFEKIPAAVDALSEKIVRYQGEGDYGGVLAFLDEFGRIDPALQRDLDRVHAAGIPVDVVFEQDVRVLRGASGPDAS